MRVNSIQLNMYKSAPKTQTTKNVSHQGVKGALKGAGIGGVGMGAIVILALASWPAALILGGITAGCSAVVGSGVEDYNKAHDDNKTEEKKNN